MGKQVFSIIKPLSIFLCALAAYGILWLERPGSWWGYIFHVSLKLQESLNQEGFLLADITPFAWDKVCLADRGYYTADADQKLKESVHAKGFETYSLWLNSDGQGGYLLFIKNNKVIPVEWNRFSEFGSGALINQKCWDKSLHVKMMERSGKRMYFPI